MTRERMFGSDTEFCAWMRACKELPAYSQDFGFVAADNDITVHRYMTSVDNLGTREVQGLMQIEVKTRKGKPSSSQIDTLSKLNLFSGSKNINGCQVTFFGVFVLVLSGVCPDTSQSMWWGKIPRTKVITDATKLTWKSIDRNKLIKLLRFELHPVSLTSRTFRRHHKTTEIVVTEVSPLGFEYDKLVKKRS